MSPLDSWRILVTSTPALWAACNMSLELFPFIFTISLESLILTVTSLAFFFFKHIPFTWCCRAFFTPCDNFPMALCHYCCIASFGLSCLPAFLNFVKAVLHFLECFVDTVCCCIACCDSWRCGRFSKMRIHVSKKPQHLPTNYFFPAVEVNPNLMKQVLLIRGVFLCMYALLERFVDGRVQIYFTFKMRRKTRVISCNLWLGKLWPLPHSIWVCLGSKRLKWFVLAGKFRFGEQYSIKIYNPMGWGERILGRTIIFCFYVKDKNSGWRFGKSNKLFG